jgi:ribonucleotide reductase beta subunit family protein with ferritin-like domain
VIDWIMGDYRVEGLTPEILKSYIKDRINESMVMIGFEGLPLSEADRSNLKHTRWMAEEALGVSITDFFQKRPVDYGKSTQTFNAEDLF